MPSVSEELRAPAQKAYQELSNWLNGYAYPLWSTQGVDAAHGGFEESLDHAGKPLNEPRRGRVQPRQIYCFAQAPALGWQGDGKAIVIHGVTWFLNRYRRGDGLFRTLVSPQGAPLDDRALLYDQAFALLAFAAAAPLVGSRFDLVSEAGRLRIAIRHHFGRKGPGFESSPGGTAYLESNPHMHLFEACLAWREQGGESVWGEMADELGELALAKFIDPVSGALRESFAPDWTPAPGLAGRIVEPGHQFEWAYLLLRWQPDRPDIRKAAARLIEIGERHGVRGSVAINTLLDDLSVHDDAARLWPQTERLKAAALSARVVGEARYWQQAAAAAAGLSEYLATPVRGLWYDRLLTSGRFIEEKVPASSFYHIVGSILELDAALR
jgi:mannose/cellobiose epimerase-like protein (N-acyl-D-glucosamine 2-epimerase family)